MASAASLVLLAGGFGHRNIGDEAQLAHALYHWRRQLAALELLVLSPDPEDTGLRHRVASAHASRIAFFKADRQPHYHRSDAEFERRFWDVARRTIGAAKRLALGLDAGASLDAEEVSFLRLLQRADTLHLVGGGCLTEMTKSRLWDGALLATLCDLLDVRLICTGHTFGPFLSDPTRRLAACGFRTAAYFSTRDAASLSDLQSLSHRNNTDLAFDDALFVRAAPTEAAAATLAACGIDPARPYVVVNWAMYADKATDEGAWLPLTRQMAELCDFIHARHCQQILMVPTCPSDVGWQHRVREHTQKAQPVVLDCGLDHQVSAACIRRAHACISFKHHPGIFALGGAVPTLLFYFDSYYRRKNWGALALFGLERFAIDEATFLSDELFARTTELFSTCAQISAGLRGRLEKMKALDGVAIDQSAIGMPRRRLGLARGLNRAFTRPPLLSLAPA